MKSQPNKLLLVDDDVDNSDMLSRRLIRKGYRVEVARSGESALEKLDQSHYDLVLLDQMMPGMSGLDLLRLLRATYSPSELPVIMVTAVDQSEAMVEALHQGANDYVCKPVDLPVVTARIESQLTRSSADRMLKASDPLTGLANRSQLMHRLSSSVVRSHAAGEMPVGVLLLDLDGFKVVNDSFGHRTGDYLLIQVAVRLRKVVEAFGLSRGTTIARMGGDEFVILVDSLQDKDQLEMMAGAILTCLAQSVLIDGLELSIRASIGLAVLRDEHGTAEALLREADLAMYRAKELGKNRWHMFEPFLNERAQARMATVIDLRHAPERGELFAVYQPKVNLATQAIVGFEALLRWRHPVRGLLSPADFIPVAEETGLIIPIGEWILGEACRQLKIWQLRFPANPPLSMNVNLSVKQLTDPNLLRAVTRALTETGIPPETLKLELTESSLMTEIESATHVLANIRAMRVGLYLDDFGTGYSSLGYLKNFRFDSVKIDPSFVNKLTSDPESHAIVETIVNLAKTLRMTVVAEGIENESQLNELTRLGCHTGQGYYFSPALESEPAERLLEACQAGTHSSATRGLPPTGLPWRSANL